VCRAPARWPRRPPASLLVSALLMQTWRYRDLATTSVPPRFGPASCRPTSVTTNSSPPSSAFEAVRLILDAYFSLSAELLRRSERPPPDLLVWPETVHPTTFGAPKSPEGASSTAPPASSGIPAFPVFVPTTSKTTTS
jgi:apolipoprotein N-acyltransferase